MARKAGSPLEDVMDLAAYLPGQGGGYLRCSFFYMSFLGFC